MKLAIISFTAQGSRLNGMLTEILSRDGYDCKSYANEKYAQEYGLKPLSCSLHDWTARMFEEADALLFIGAAGIAVRSIAPFLVHKSEDPAVVVMDEKGMFAISLLSGHLGGANELAGALANLTGAIPVITTATDVNGRFAVDLFAKKNGLYIADMTYAKAISADVLDEKEIGFFTEFPVLGEIPQELCLWTPETVFAGTNGICVTLDAQKKLFKQTLCLIPRIVTVGVGCKKGTETEKIEEAVRFALSECGISGHAVEQIASIDLKAEERGIVETAKRLGVPFVTYSAQQLREVQGTFSASAFVKSVTGVDNVCERSALLASDSGKLLHQKTAGDGVTTALAIREWSVEFG